MEAPQSRIKRHTLSLANVSLKLVNQPAASSSPLCQTLLMDTVDTLKQFIHVLENLHYDEYVEPHAILSHGTVGQHTRHTVELFQQLLEGYQVGEIDYDNRKRDHRLSHHIDSAIEAIAEIICQLNKQDKTLKLKGAHLNEAVLSTSYARELLYNLEHCIHHQAIIKIALISAGRKDLSTTFGVAKSTLLNRQ
jgi:hypothetical protein